MLENYKTLYIEEVLGRFLNKYIIDVRKDRINKRWIFTEFPESDSNYPEIIIKLDDVEYEYDSAGNFFMTEFKNDLFYEYYYKKAIANIHIYVLTDKRSKYNINNEGLTLYGKYLNLYLIEQIKQKINQYKNILLQDFIRVDIINISPSFEDDKNSWAGDINLKITYRDKWADVYKDGTLIKSYSLNTIIGG